LKFANKITVLVPIILVFCFLFVSNGFASSAGIVWLSYDDGISVVETEPKKLLINFYSDRCEYCKVMDEETFKDSAIVSYINKNFIPVRVNSDKDRKTAEIFKVRGLPDTWFLSETKDVIGHRPGFIPAETMIMVLKYINTNSYKNMSFKSFADSH
jgi:thioredoxin-related protein